MSKHSSGKYGPPGRGVVRTDSLYGTAERAPGVHKRHEVYDGPCRAFEDGLDGYVLHNEKCSGSHQCGVW